MSFPQSKRLSERKAVFDCGGFAQRKDNDAGGAVHLELLFHSKFFLKAI